MTDKKNQKNLEKLENIYEFKLVCTYSKIKDYDESEILYKMQFLQLFKLEDFHDDTINNTTELLFNYFITINKNEKVQNLIDVTTMKDDLLSGFRMFYAFPTLHMFHKLLFELYYEKDFDEENYNQLINFAKTNY